MLNYSSRRSRRKKLLLFCIPLAFSLSFVGIIVISAIGMLRPDQMLWKGFKGVDTLEKLPPETNSLASIEESDAVEFIKLNTPSETSSDTYETNTPSAPEINPDHGDAPDKGQVRDHILKETAVVADDYFADTLFIGDSRMVGLGMIGQSTGATFYAGVGLSINQLNRKKIIKVNADLSYTVMEAIEKGEKVYKRVYLMFGLNELGWAYPSVFVRSVDDAVTQLRELCPGIEICLMAIMPISADKSVSIYTGAAANERIREFNSLLLQLASDRDCWYLDTYNLFADENGALPENFAADGIHMYSEQYKTLLAYIRSHAFAS